MHLLNLNLIPITVYFYQFKSGICSTKKWRAFCEKNRDIYQERRDTLVDGFRTFGWNVDKPAGSMFVWAEIPQGWTSLDFAYALMDRANVVVTPGHAFGPHGEGFVRIALVQDKEVLQQVVENIRNSGIFVLEKVDELVKISSHSLLNFSRGIINWGTFICILKTRFPIVIHF